VVAVAAVAAYAGVTLAAWSSIQSVNDYAGFVAGARAILAGESPYDPATWPTAWERLGTQRPDTSVYGYPAWVALLFLPLAPLPIALGSLLFNVGTLALAVLAARSLARRVNAPPFAAMLLATASWPAFLVFLQGQWAYLLFALAVYTYLDLARGRDARAGVWWSVAILLKPQLFVLGSLALAAYLIRARRWRVFVAAAGVSLVAVLGAALVVPGWWTPWLGAVAPRRLVRSTQQPTFAGVAADIAAEWWPIAWGAIVLGLAVAILWAARRAPGRRGPVLFFGFLALSIGAAPYSWSYDHYLAIGCGVVALGLASGAGAGPLGGRPSAGAITLGTFALFAPIALLLWLSAFARFHDTGSGLVPALAILLLAAAARARATPAGPG
jgi:hypothetical protein